MDHAAIVGLVIEKESIVVLTFVVHLASNADAVIVNAVCGDDLDASAVVVGDDVLNGMRARVAYVYSSLCVSDERCGCGSPTQRSGIYARLLRRRTVAG